MRDDAAAGEVDHVDGAGVRVDGQRGARPLRRRDRGQHAVVPEHRREAVVDGAPDFLIAFIELAVETAHVQVIHAGQPAQLLVGGEANAQHRVARHRAEVRAMAVNRQLAVAPHMGQRGEADAVDIDHHAGAALFLHQVVAAQHVLHVAGDVERIHGLLAGRIGHPPDLRHDRRDAPGQRSVRRVGLQFVVLDEVESGRCEIAHELAQCLGGQSDAGLDDGADQRPAVHLRQVARALDAEAGARITLGERLRQLQVHQTNAGQFLQLI